MSELKPVPHWDRLLPDFPMLERRAGVMSGRPVVKGTRLPVSNIVCMLSSGQGRWTTAIQYGLNLSFSWETIDCLFTQCIEFTERLLDEEGE